jgi:hypothetical protein
MVTLTNMELYILLAYIIYLVLKNYNPPYWKGYRSPYKKDEDSEELE